MWARFIERFRNVSNVNQIAAIISFYVNVLRDRSRTGR